MAFEYMEVFYNRKRLHSTLGYKSPMQFLSDWLSAQQQEKLVACPPCRKTKNRGKVRERRVMKYSIQRLVFAFLVLTLPSFAHAHVGAGEASGWMHGLSHPFGGLDHVCAMIAVGLWAAQMGGRAVWRVPLAFVCVMMPGGLLGMAAIPVPFSEAGIIMSLLGLGVLIAAAVRLPLPVSIAMVGVFAVFHGYAHGSEIPQSASGLGYAAGFAVATALLHLSGTGTALFLKRLGRARLLRAAGGAVAVCGGYLWFVA